MPEANVLYSVTAVVVIGLVSWVAVVLKTAKEPWARDLPKPVRVVDADVPLEPTAENAMTSEGAPLAKVSADATAEATAVVVGNDAKADDAKSAKADDAKSEAKADDAKSEAEADDAKSEAKADDAKSAKAVDAKS